MNSLELTKIPTFDVGMYPNGCLEEIAFKQ